MRAVMDGTTELQESSRATRSPHALSRFVYLVQHMLTVMDGATELIERCSTRLDLIHLHS